MYEDRIFAKAGEPLYGKSEWRRIVLEDRMQVPLFCGFPGLHGMIEQENGINSVG